MKKWQRAGIKTGAIIAMILVTIIDIFYNWIVIGGAVLILLLIRLYPHSWIAHHGYWLYIALIVGSIVWHAAVLIEIFKTPPEQFRKRWLERQR